MMELLLALFLCVSLLLYLLFAGADFGIGMLEALSPPRLRKSMREKTYEAIGPVWEANHIWLILVVVILFVGFPRVYSTLSVALHIPLSLLLLGIILRGCAFTFRHYDAVKDGSQRYYSFLFTLSSFWTSLFLGVTVGAVLRNRLPVSADNFYDGYLAPWLDIFPFSIGVFVVFINMLLAAAYMTGEPIGGELTHFFVSKARMLIGLTVVAGLMVFICAHLDGLPLAQRFAAHWGSLTCMLAATAMLPCLYYALGIDTLKEARQVWIVRILTASLVTVVLLGWFFIQYPALVIFSDGTQLTIFNASAPTATLRGLLFALCIGVLAIFPALAYLLYVFKRPETNR